MARKIRVVDEGKTFEAFVQMMIVDLDILHGIAMAGTSTACRAIHASLYNHSVRVEISDDNGENWKRAFTTASYRRIEKVNGKVCHTILLPRMAIESEFKEEVNNMEEGGVFPHKVIIAPLDSLREKAGLFLADAFGLPKTKEWSEKYLSLLNEDKYETSTYLVETTELAPEEWKNLGAVVIRNLKEKTMLDYVEKGIQDGIFSVRTDLGSEATFHQDMTTEEYLTTNARSIASHIDKHMKPQYDGKSYIKPVGNTTRTSLPAQARAVMGTLEILKKENSAYVVGDMGTGSVQRSW